MSIRRPRTVIAAATAAAATLATAIVVTTSTGASAANEQVVTPIDSKVLETAVSAKDAAKAGRYAYDRPTAENSVLLLVDHQVGLMSGVQDHASLAEYKNNVVALAKSAKAFNIPVILTTSNAQWQNGDLLPEIKAEFPDAPIIRRTGIINAYADPVFRKAVEDTGRKHVLIAGVTLGTCTAFPTLSMLQDGYKVFPVVDAAGAWSKYEADAAIDRMTAAGAEPVTVFPLLAELQYDWRRDTNTAAGEIFRQHLPEYGLVMDNFWTTVDPQKRPADPFGLVK